MVNQSDNTMPHKNLKQRLLFPVLALLMGCLPLVGLEWTLRALGIGAQESVVDRSFGFGDYQPLFVLSREEQHFRTSHNKALYFGTQQFQTAKAEHEYRIFFLGGSTVRGRPFTVDTAFAKWVELELNARCESSRQYQSINCGGLSYASYRLVRIHREILEYDPDLVVVATGHNEFLEDRTFHDAKQHAKSKLGSSLHSINWIRSLQGDDVQSFKDQSQQKLPANVKARLDANSGYASYHWDPEWKQQVIEQYRQSLETIIAQCMESRTALVFVCLGSNLRDCPPIKSELPDTLRDSTRQNWLSLFADATRYRHDPITALEKYQHCVEIFGEHALLHYRIARCHELLNHPALARKHYLLAKDYDICPLRLTEQMDSIQRELAAKHGIPLVDARQAIEQASVDKIPGYEMYVDHVHPSIHGHQIIASAIVEKLSQSQILPGGKLFSVADYADLYNRHLHARPMAYFSNGRRRVEWLEGWARWERQQQELRPLDLRARVALAERLFGFAQHEQAAMELGQAMLQDFEATPAILQLALRMQRQGDYSNAARVLQWLHEHIENPVFDETLQFARMINATSRDDRDLAHLIYDQYFQRTVIISEQLMVWHELRPDMLERITAEVQ